jgi:hypothetical protein
MNFGTLQHLHLLDVGANTTASIDANGQYVIVTDALALAGSFSNNPTGTFNLHDNPLLIHNGDLPTVLAAIAAGYHGGDWQGPGITSSFVAAHTTNTTVACDLAQNISTTPFTWFGQTVNSGDVLVLPTLIGDVNMDGQVDSEDYFALTPNLGATGRTWGSGDLNGDGTVNSLDYYALTANLGKTVAGQSPNIAQPNGGATVTPEPASLVLLALSGLLVLGPRRRPRHAA